MKEIDQEQEPEVKVEAAPEMPGSDSDFTVHLDRVFQGPLDLLLHLVREQEVEIHEIEIGSVIEGFMEYVKALEKLDLEFAGDFVVMAATLMAIKSRSLLPKEEVNLEEDLDPRDELIQRLIEYRKFKSASQDLEDRAEEREQLRGRGWRGEVKAHETEPVLEMGDLTAWDLLGAFSRLMREVDTGRTEKIYRDPRPMRWYVESLVGNIRTSGTMSLRAATESLGDGLTKESLIGTFCALLELVRLELVDVVQDNQSDDILLKINEEGDAANVMATTVFEDDDQQEVGSEAQSGHQTGA
ncbi:MAG: segregation/condensation protein A [Planctomycetota bacterium]|nr:segregation/condensation protein A [Planctomycetota bacterium]MDG2142267.1 segregation/condensation protein A [Planctomycetota bacterium]